MVFCFICRMLHFPGARLQQWLSSLQSLCGLCFCNLSDQQIFWHPCVLRGEGRHLVFSWNKARHYCTFHIQCKAPTETLQFKPVPLCVGVHVETSPQLCEPLGYWRCRIPLQRVLEAHRVGGKALKLCCSGEQCCLVPSSQLPGWATPLVLAFCTKQGDEASLLLLEPVPPLWGEVILKADVGLNQTQRSCRCAGSVWFAVLILSSFLTKGLILKPSYFASAEFSHCNIFTGWHL